MTFLLNDRYFSCPAQLPHPFMCWSFEAQKLNFYKFLMFSSTLATRTALGTLFTTTHPGLFHDHTQSPHVCMHLTPQLSRTLRESHAFSYKLTHTQKPIFLTQKLIKWERLIIIIKRGVVIKKLIFGSMMSMASRFSVETELDTLLQMMTRS